mgnify:CR=1 FL=1
MYYQILSHGAKDILVGGPFDVFDSIALTTNVERLVGAIHAGFVNIPDQDLFIVGP